MAQSLAEEVRRPGLFYSLQYPTWPPFPANPFPDLPVYRIEADRFVYDDRTVDYDQRKAEAEARAQALAAEQEPAQTIGGPLSYGPGDLWLEITAASEGTVSLILHGTVEDAPYEVFSTTDLGTPRWKPEAIVIGQADQTPVNLTETGEPVRFFRALKGETIVSISAVADASEPGPNGDPPGDLGQFMVFRSGPTNQALAVAYSISGTATNGVDYTELPGSITIPVGEESALISVEALYDDLAEFDETVTLTLELTGEYLIDPAYCEATVTIQCNAFVAVAELDGPVGIDYHGPLNSLIVSHNAATSGNPRNFARIDSSGQVTPWSSVSNLLEEVKVATAKQSAGGWQQGQLYFGLGAAPGAEGRIGRVSADGTGVTSSWANLPPPTDEIFRGGLTFDQTGVFGGDLIAVNGRPYEQGGLRQVWRLNSAGAPTLIASIQTSHLEGVAVLPDDPVWGDWAGKILTGNEYAGVIYAVDTNGAATPYSLGIHPEDFDLIPPDQDLYCTAYEDSAGAILKIPRAYFADYVGQLLITQAGEHMQPAALYIVRWDGRPVVSVRIPYPSGYGWHFEHVTFAPVSLPPLP